MVLNLGFMETTETHSVSCVGCCSTYSEDDSGDEFKRAVTITDELTDAVLDIQIIEHLDPSFCMFTWPSAILLAHYMWLKRELWKNKKIIELGAGTGLPGFVASKCGADVTLTDAKSNKLCLQSLHKAKRANNVTNNVNVIALDWGYFTPELLALEPFDFILGSDCFYDKESYDDLLALITFLFMRNKYAKCIVAYHQRRAGFSFESRLRKWNLTFQLMKEDSFARYSVTETGSSLWLLEIFPLVDEQQSNN